MNSVMQEYYPLFEMYQSLRTQLMELLTDEDLAFAPGGDNRPLGELCREIGEVEVAYIQSLQTLTQNFNYRNETPGLAGSVAMLQNWFKQLDGELKAVFSAFSEEDLQTKIIDRGHNFRLPPRIQLEVYKEALLIFYGKADVYLQALGKERPPHWHEWIG